MKDLLLIKIWEKASDRAVRDAVWNLRCQFRPSIIPHSTKTEVIKFMVIEVHFLDEWNENGYKVGFIG